MRRIFLALLGLGLFAAALVLAEAGADPVVRRVAVRMPDWPAGAGPVRVLLWSDLHLGNMATGPRRLARLVGLADALRPDLVVIAGDLVAGHEREDAGAAVGLAALGRLRPPLGVVAVLGNHDHWTDAGLVRAALEGAGVIVLDNEARRLGPLAVGGLGDMVTGRARFADTLGATRAAGGARLVLSHTPDAARHLPRDAPLLVAGHTHCGQLAPPLLGPVVEVSAPRYRCGLRREGGRLVVTTAGTGTSVLPIRWGAPPDWWLLTLGP